MLSRLDNRKLWQRGALTAKVRARDERTGKFISFTVDFEANEELDDYDFCDYLGDAVRALANLRKAERPEVVDILKRED